MGSYLAEIERDKGTKLEKISDEHRNLKDSCALFVKIV